MTILHNLGFPRIVAQRELKRALEAYWAGKEGVESLLETGRELRARHWAVPARAGMALVPVGDFAWYDQILVWTTLIGAVPARFGQSDQEPVGIATLLRMARGRAPSGSPAAACEIPKLLDPKSHYNVPQQTPA